VIFFVPGYDLATRANLAVAERILKARDHALLGEGATRPHLLLALASRDSPLFVMSHGRRDEFAAQGGDPALRPVDTPRLGRRPVFAYACHTAGGLGQAAAGNGSVWWGYTGAVTAPPDSPPELLSLYSGIFEYLCSAFAVQSPAGRRAVLLRLADLCHEVEEKVDELLASGIDLDAGSAYLSLLHLWQRVRICEPETADLAMHPDAPPPALFL
jgi:hypothetical protein